MIRSLLYVPALNERFVGKAHERGADAIILDLEDSIPLAEKDAARAALDAAVPAVGRNGGKVFVRVNAEPDLLRADAEAAARAGAFGLVLAKAKSHVEIAALTDFLTPIERRVVRPELAFIALIEDPGAVLDARPMAALPRVMGLMTGSEDLALSLGAQPIPDVLRFPKLMVHYAAKAEAKLSFGLMRSIADFADLEGLAEATREAAAHGFDGATCIHPSAIAVINEAFTPSAEEIAWAERVVEEAAAGRGIVVVNGRMVDAPVVARARAILGG